MAINEWKVWQKLGWVTPKVEIIDIDKELEPIELFLKEVSPSIKQLHNYVKSFHELRRTEIKLRQEGKSIHTITLKQIKIFDEILKIYQFFQLDADINGVRVKKIAKNLGRKAREQDISDKWLDIIRKTDRWNFNW